MTLVFDKAAHRYYNEEGELPSVTRILAAEGITPSYVGADPLPALRGTYVHRLTEALDRGEDHTLIPPPDGLSLAAVQGYLDSYLSWKELSGYQWEVIEGQYAHPIYGYAGTIDRARPLIDLKTGAEGEPLQLAAYWELLMVNGKPCKPEGSFLYLHENGSPATRKPVPGLDKLARIFHAVKACYDYKRRK